MQQLSSETHSSKNLVKIASQHSLHTSIVADTLSLPHPRSSFDFVISIAVIHHLSTSRRRVEALAAILETLRPSSSSCNEHPDDGKKVTTAPPHQCGIGGGRALIYVWALEQKHSRRGWDEGDAQDVMVPWVMKSPPVDDGHEGHGAPPLPAPPQSRTTLERFYHLYRRGELEEDIRKAGGTVEKSGYEKDNWWAVAWMRRSNISETWHFFSPLSAWVCLNSLVRLRISHLREKNMKRWIALHRFYGVIDWPYWPASASKHTILSPLPSRKWK